MGGLRSDLQSAKNGSDQSKQPGGRITKNAWSLGPIEILASRFRVEVTGAICFLPGHELRPDSAHPSYAGLSRVETLHPASHLGEATCKTPPAWQTVGMLRNPKIPDGICLMSPGRCHLISRGSGLGGGERQPDTGPGPHKDLCLMTVREDVKLNRLHFPEPEYVLFLIPSLRTVSFFYIKLFNSILQELCSISIHSQLLCHSLIPQFLYRFLFTTVIPQ
ncbi:hypothetical protein CPAR01_04925 [Colletotrichum paranaense]|uniref:Uncharacterized protein n=1 Tax=Colletotrichum paranaense TaxID=1914294 RepID=A0ABQ9SXN9_9PEZI|nr:uncharacterized protein CPAR01_04925 [Colletotrichum paranaense]KAK1544292.1 hypothetical protein CPAR01_04925 [Colletotrichum paranaense]